jgi:hypothetical protein
MSNEARRSELFSLLSEACEVEHGLACSYLYAAFSLKRGQTEGLDFAQEQRVRRWASEISFVATQEMLHLAQAWNLLQAIGGTPYHLHPIFPLVRGGLPIPVRMSLEGFSKGTLDRFLGWERPADLHPDATEDEPYATVGELYDRVDHLLRMMPESKLFIADPALQIGPELADFPDLVRVVDAASAQEAIRRIRSQGEGSTANRADCHFGIFRAIRQELSDELLRDPKFAPAHHVVSNPTRRPHPGATVVTEEKTLRVMDLFDDLYGLTIRALAWTFASARPTEPTAIQFARFAIRAMPALLGPLGALLMRLPSGLDGRNAGPPFGLSRHVPLPDDVRIARTIVRERVEEIATGLETCARDSAVPNVRTMLDSATRVLNELSAPLRS